MNTGNIFEKFLLEDNARECALVQMGLECLNDNKPIPFHLKMSLEAIDGVKITSNKTANEVALNTALETLTGVQKLIAGGALVAIISLLMKFFGGNGGGGSSGGGGGGGGKSISKDISTTQTAKDDIVDNLQQMGKAILHNGLDEKDVSIVNELLDHAMVSAVPHSTHVHSNPQKTREQVEAEVIKLLEARGKPLLKKILFNFGKQVNKVYFIDANATVFKHSVEFMSAFCEDIEPTLHSLLYAIEDFAEGVRESGANIDDIVNGKSDVPYRFSFYPPKRLLNAVNALDGSAPKSHWLVNDVILLSTNVKDKIHKLHTDMRKSLTPEAISEMEELLEESLSKNPIVIWAKSMDEILETAKKLPKLQNRSIEIQNSFEDVGALMAQLGERGVTSPNILKLKHDFEKVEKVYRHILNMFGFIANNLSNNARAYALVAKRIDRMQDIVKSAFDRIVNERHK